MRAQPFWQSHKDALIFPCTESRFLQNAPAFGGRTHDAPPVGGPMHRFVRSPLALVIVATVAIGCSTRDATTDSAKVHDSAMAAAAAPAAAAPSMTDANIFAVLDAANVADSSDGSVAATKGTSADVKA